MTYNPKDPTVKVRPFDAVEYLDTMEAIRAFIDAALEDDAGDDRKALQTVGRALAALEGKDSA